MEKVLDAIRAIRARRAEMNVVPSRKTKLYMVTKDVDVFGAAEGFFRKLAGASEVLFPESYEDEGSVSIVTDAVTVYIPLADMIDFEKEKARLSKELEKTEGEIKRLSGKLSNEGFLAKAPEAVVAQEKEKLAKYEATKESLLAELKKLG
jgi:valyl-tRNA synthetase